MKVNMRTTGGDFFRINNVSMLCLLIGTINDTHMLTQFGCQCDPTSGEVNFDRLTGEVASSFGDGSSPRIYIAGSAASNAQDRNQEVIPGLTGQVAQIAWMEMLRGEGA